jgi:hypothetical protein
LEALKALGFTVSGVTKVGATVASLALGAGLVALIRIILIFIPFLLSRRISLWLT